MEGARQADSMRLINLKKQGRPALLDIQKELRVYRYE